jgi:hypothetical protein
MGLAGIDPEKAADGVAGHHAEAQPLPGRDLSELIGGRTTADALAAPVYFMTEDNPSKGSSQVNIITGDPFEAVGTPCSIESVIATLPTGGGGDGEMWKLNHYYERLDEWYAAKGFATNPFVGPAAEPLFELHNLTVDPEERHNRVGEAPEVLSRMTSTLEAERDGKRRVPSLRNAG